ncbi:ABC transporter ATP-binding protein [Paenibacillus oceani]|uniref:ABC transporter ATP-binding protein n=1 Tax=Paenibacillus oceani TaxID=2772510 RepID=A0A927CBT8_9BACL|nr:ABC transporter ATP-binding protein [Paenibacillus oceani]MBD2863111.1 ABC transporter ATP-binding protein [Paenibacillus oceani]
MSNLIWLARLAGKAKWLLLLSVVLMTAESLSYLMQTGLQQTIIDDVLMAGRTELFWPTLLQIAAAYIAYSLLFTFGPHAIHHTVARVRHSLSGSLMDRLHQIPSLDLQKERTGHYVYHFTTDLQNVAGMTGGDLPRLFQHLTTVLFLSYVIAKANLILFAVLAAFSVIYVLLGKRFAAERKQAAAEINRTKSALLVHMEESISSTREVIAFHRQSWESAIYKKRFGAYYRDVMREGKLINRQQLISDPLRWGTTWIVLLAGGLLVIDGQLSLGMFVITYQFANRFMDSFHGLYQFALGLSGKVSSVERLRRYLDGDRLHSLGDPLQGPLSELRFEQVSFAYDTGRNAVLAGISLDIPLGRKVALVGTSGGGKSTLAGLLLRFLEPTDGVLAVNGRPLPEWSRGDWMNRVAVVLQDPYFFPDTIRTNLLLGLEQVSDRTMIEVCEAMQIHDFIMNTPQGYNTVIGERGITLSGGQRQRLALARALLRNPDILILDESTSALDLETERCIQEQLDIIREGQTTIIIAHRLSTIRNADLIVVLDKGKLAESGSHDQLMQDGPLYRELVWKEQEGEGLVAG